LNPDDYGQLKAVKKEAFDDQKTNVIQFAPRIGAPNTAQFQDG
jgi:hypothetical protein